MSSVSRSIAPPPVRLLDCRDRARLLDMLSGTRRTGAPPRCPR
jgi:hypothetical protein